MPVPSSTTRIRLLPPSSISTVMWRAWASRAFSTSSFTTAAGRVITSPAAMREAVFTVQDLDAPHLSLALTPALVYDSPKEGCDPVLLTAPPVI